jgi:hypothetical protein
MRIVIENINENLASALRRCGYHFERQHQDTGEVSAARDLARGGFPRFHVYAKLIYRGLTPIYLEINLHLDQKRPSYTGTRAHGGEHEGEVIEEEARRIKSILGK